jgi:hypothetical protein
MVVGTLSVCGMRALVNCTLRTLSTDELVEPVKHVVEDLA